jgi:hypothetical protein
VDMISGSLSKQHAAVAGEPQVVCAHQETRRLTHCYTPGNRQITSWIIRTCNRASFENTVAEDKFTRLQTVWSTGSAAAGCPTSAPERRGIGTSTGGVRGRGAAL